jgi:hypothetical protein
MALGASASYCGHRVAVHPEFHTTEWLEHNQLLLRTFISA